MYAFWCVADKRQQREDGRLNKTKTKDETIDRKKNKTRQKTEDNTKKEHYTRSAMKYQNMRTSVMNKKITQDKTKETEARQ